MTDRHPGILTVRDTEILRLLRRLVSIGVYRGTFTADDVTRVASQWLTPRLAVVVPLRVAADKSRSVVNLTRRQADVIQELCDGTAPTNVEIARRLGISRNATKDRLTWAMRAIGAKDRRQIISLISSGRVRIVIKTEGSQAS